MPQKTRIAILGGGEEELNILSEFHRAPGIEIVGIYDRDPRAVALEIAEIIGISTFSNDSFLSVFLAADHVVVTEKRKLYAREIELLTREHARIVNPAEAANHLAASERPRGKEQDRPWPEHLDEALQYLHRITDRERLLRWLLEISVRAVGASSGSIMLYSAETEELYIGYASELSAEVVEKTRQKLGDGIAGAVASSRTARLIREIVDTPLYREGRERERIQSAVSAPLIHEGRLLGVLNVSTNTGEKRLAEEDVATITLLAAKIAPILDQHLRIDAHEIREIELQVRNYLESLFRVEAGFHEKFTELCRFLATKLSADTATIYTATDEGDWLILGGSDQQMPSAAGSPRIHCNRGSLARAYLSGEEVLMTEATSEAIMKIKVADGAITSIYLPLVHQGPLGVAVFEFSALGALQRFFRMKDAIRFQIGFFAFILIRDLRQARKLDSLEELSGLAPVLLSLDELPQKIRRMPALLSSLIRASSASLHFTSADYSESAYFQFPEEEGERRKRMEYDAEILGRVQKNWEPVCLSYLTTEIALQGAPPPYRSVIGYPLHRSADATAIYIGYDKAPVTPLDSSIFGDHELELLRKVDGIIAPALARRPAAHASEKPVTFEDLLRYNQKIFIERIREEIERAERYHHGFTVTLFKITGLSTYIEKSYQGGLSLVNELSIGIRQKVRRTDFFSWIEPDLFGVLSLEGYQRLGFLEGRINGFITETLRAKGLFHPATFNAASGYAMYPGRAESAADLIAEAKSRLG